MSGFAILFLLSSHLFALTLTNQKQKIAITTSSLVNLNPFQIIIDSAKKDEILMVSISASCSSFLETQTFSEENEKFVCLLSDEILSLEDANALLRSIKIQTISNSPNKMENTITYKIKAMGEETEFLQTVDSFSSIPITTIAQTFYFDPNSSKTSEQKILSVDPSYLSSFESSELKFDCITTVPSYLRITLKSAELFFTTSKAGYHLSDRIMRLSVFDLKTRLESESIDVKLKPIYSQTEDSDSSNTETFLKGCIALLLVIVLAFAVVLYFGFKRSNQTIEIRRNIEQNSELKIVSQNEMKTIIMSDSILQWNKMLMEKYSKKKGDHSGHHNSFSRNFEFDHKDLSPRKSSANSSKFKDKFDNFSDISMEGHSSKNHNSFVSGINI